MYTNLGETLKTLRKARDLTQEQLAECLGVSSQAVSKWETGTSYPDISMLPVLANFYEVTTDELLGVDVSKTQDKIEKIILHAERCKTKEKIDLYRQALAEYPASDELMLRLASALNYPNEPETYEKRWEERVSLLKSVAGSARDFSNRNLAEGRLCMAYREKGMREEAMQIANRIPAQPFTSQYLLRMLAQGKEKVYAYHNSILHSFANLCEEILYLGSIEVEGKPFFAPEDAIAILQKIPTLLHTFYEDGDYLGDNQILSLAYTRMGERYAERGDREHALACLESALSAARAADAFYADLAPGYYRYDEKFGEPVLPKEKRHTSILARPELDYPTMTSSFGYNDVGGIKTVTARVKDAVKDERFAFIHDEVKELFAGN